MVSTVNRYSFHVSRDECWNEILTFATVYQEGSWRDLLDKLRGKGIYGLKAGGSTSWVSRHPNGAVVFFSPSDRYKHLTELLCLPNTVDPREPWK